MSTIKQIQLGEETYDIAVEAENIEGQVSGMLPTGGTTGQVLKKTSGTDYAVEWGDAGGGDNGIPEFRFTTGYLGFDVALTQLNNADVQSLLDIVKKTVDLTTYKLSPIILTGSVKGYQQYTSTLMSPIKCLLNSSGLTVVYTGIIFTTNTSSETGEGAFSKFSEITLYLVCTVENNQITGFSFSKYKTHNEFQGYLSKTNTDSYTPTGNYHPATKKYVDDSIAAIPTGDSSIIKCSLTTTAKFTEVLNTNSYWSMLDSTNRTAMETAIADAITNNKKIEVEINFANDSTNWPMRMIFQQCGPIDNSTTYYNFYFRSIYNAAGVYKMASDNVGVAIITLRIGVNKSGNSYTVTAIRLEPSRASFLPIGGSSVYTPTGNYDPATKKYVDDAYKAYSGYDADKTQVLKNVNGTLTWVDE